MAKQLKVTQIKSKVSEKQYQRDTLRSLGLKRIGDSVVRDGHPAEPRATSRPSPTS
jgi:large subunit ribosomal protein L30